MTAEKKESIRESWIRLKRSVGAWLKTNWTMISCTCLILSQYGGKGVSVAYNKGSNFMDSIECARMLGHVTAAKLADHLEDVRVNKLIRTNHESEQDKKLERDRINIERLLVKNDMRSEEAVNDTMNPADRSNTRIAFIK